MLNDNGHNDYAIEFRDVSRRFVLHHEQRASFQDWFIGLIRPRGHAEEFWALRDVTFGVRRGETIGLVGRNGAGKSTLLKLVTRILEPSSGNVSVNGRSYAMLELGAGFHPELSGRDNIFLNGSLYGFSRKEMSGKYEQIVRFSELERFVDTPVKHYSSGMFARLGFGIAISMAPEILVIDEVLAVGDSSFQEKCLRALADLKAKGTTILFVSHDADTVRSFCDRAALLVDGHLIDIGPANDVVDHYARLLMTREPRFSLLRVRALDELRLPTEAIRSGDDLTVEALIRAPEGLDTSILSLQIDIDQIDGVNLWETRINLPSELPLTEQAASQRSENLPDTRVARVTLPDFPIASGAIRLSATLLDTSGEQSRFLDHQETILRVESTHIDDRGLLRLEHHWEWEQPQPTPPVEASTGGVTERLRGLR
ncbi:MAG: ATP-binding cassette domain-containing protein [Chloroflexia bacterium]|nr:ATP-binding cassette domain-containing protein [Chloroflexia bacterium]